MVHIINLKSFYHKISKLKGDFYCETSSTHDTAIKSNKCETKQANRINHRENRFLNGYQTPISKLKQTTRQAIFNTRPFNEATVTYNAHRFNQQVRHERRCFPNSWSKWEHPRSAREKKHRNIFNNIFRRLHSSASLLQFFSVLHHVETSNWNCIDVCMCTRNFIFSLFLLLNHKSLHHTQRLIVWDLFAIEKAYVTLVIWPFNGKWK